MGAPALTSQGLGCLLASGCRKPDPVMIGMPINHSTDNGSCQLLVLGSLVSLGVSACVEWWNAPAVWALHTSPHLQSHCRILVRSGQLRQRPREWLHVVPLASVLAKSLTELDLRWALLGCLNAVLVFFATGARRHPSLQLHPSNGNWDKISWTNCTRRMDFQRKRSGSAAPVLHRDGAGRWTLHAFASSQGQGPTGSRPSPVQHYPVAEPVRRNIHGGEWGRTLAGARA